MAKQKRRKKEEKKTYEEVTFVGGPRDGRMMHLMNNPMPPFLKLAFPEWCHYFHRPGTLEYEYDMEREPIPHPHDFRTG